jgi:hypothetical protein
MYRVRAQQQPEAPATDEAVWRNQIEALMAEVTAHASLHTQYTHQHSKYTRSCVFQPGSHVSPGGLPVRANSRRIRDIHSCTRKTHQKTNTHIHTTYIHTLTHIHTQIRGLQSEKASMAAQLSAALEASIQQSSEAAPVVQIAPPPPPPPVEPTVIQAPPEVPMSLVFCVHTYSCRSTVYPDKRRLLCDT